MITFKKSVLAAALLTVGAAAQAEVSANIGVTSNYIWRGVTQTADKAAISGGLDFSTESGVYGGTWVSNVDFSESVDTNIDGTDVSVIVTNGKGYEADFYVGWANDTFDVGYIYYAYPEDETNDSDFGEIYGSFSIDGFNLGLAVSVNEQAEGSDTGDVYAHGSYSFEAAEDIGIAFTVGYYDFAEDGSDAYSHIQADISKSDFTFSLSKAEEESGDDDLKLFVSYSVGF